MFANYKCLLDTPSQTRRWSRQKPNPVGLSSRIILLEEGSSINAGHAIITTVILILGPYTYIVPLKQTGINKVISLTAIDKKILPNITTTTNVVVVVGILLT